MFERYTEEARRTVFYARYEAAAAGSPYIESEHMLLALLRAHSPLAAKIPSNLEAVRKELIPAPAPRPSTSVDLPLSNAMKRVLAYAAEDAERLRHRHVGAEHLVLGLLREPESAAARFLAKHGLDRESLWAETVAAPDPARSYNREALYKLIDSLSDDALQRAGRMLDLELQWSGIPRRFGRGGGGGGGGSRHQWSQEEASEGATVVRRHSYEGHEVTVRETFGVSEDHRTLTVTVEIEHGGRRHRQTVEFDVAPRDPDAGGG
jgi:hypothetical protein